MVAVGSFISNGFVMAETAANGVITITEADGDNVFAIVGNPADPAN